MTSHHDVAVVVAELRNGASVNGVGPRVANLAAEVLESQAKALSEAEERADIWPQWAESIWAKLQEYGYQADDDCTVDLAEVFDEWADGFEAACTARALAAEARLADKEAELSIAKQINHDLTDGITGTLQKDKIESLEARLAEAMRVIEPFALVAEHDIGASETDADTYRPMTYNTVPNITVGHLRAARAFTNAAKEKT